MEKEGGNGVQLPALYRSTPVIAVRKGYIEIQRDKKWMCMERI